MLRMGVAAIRLEIGRRDNTPRDEQTCPACPEHIEDELDVFRCVTHFRYCDCDDPLLHTQHVDGEIVLLLTHMNNATCEFIHRALRTCGRTQMLQSLTHSCDGNI